MSDISRRKPFPSDDLTERQCECVESILPINKPDNRPTGSQVEDLRLAAARMREVDRRSFQAEIALKYCGGSARLAETIFGWGRQSVETGLGEKRTGILCLGARSAFSGNKRWEEKQPEAAEALRKLAESHAQQDPTFHSTMAYTRPDGRRGFEAIASARVQGRTIAMSELHVAHTEPHGILPSKGGQG